MIREDEKQAVREFLAQYPSPSIRTAGTMRKGFVTCIKPIPTICGAELMCNPAHAVELRRIISAPEGE